jgi:hypothetical protein
VKVFTPIIPNSQLVISATSKEVKSWQLELFINPMEYLVFVVFAASFILLISGIAICIIHWQEKHEDNQSRTKIEFM